MFYWVAVFFFFLAAVGSSLMPRPEAWGLVALAVGLALGGPPFFFWRRKE